MKYQLLKRTAVALFITGTVSTGAFATDPFNEAFTKAGQQLKDDLKKETEIQLNQVKTDNEKYFTNTTKQIEENTNTLKKKANISDVNDRFQATGEALEKVSEQIVDNARSIEAVNKDVEKNTQDIRVQKVSIDAKAGKKYVAEALDKKADKATVDAELAKKVSQEKLDQYHQSSVNSLAKHSDEIENIKQVHNELADHVTSEINRVTDYVNNMSDDIDTNTAEIDNIKQAHNELADHVTSEINRVTDYVNNMSDDIDTNTAEIENIKQVHNELADHVTSEINRVTDYVNNMSDDVDANTAEIEKLKTTSGFLDAAKVEKNAKDIAENKENIKTVAKTMIDGFEAISEDIKDNHRAIENVNKDVEKNTQDIRVQNGVIKTKASKEYVDGKLADKADKAALANKADQATVENYHNSLVKAHESTQKAVGDNKTKIAANKAAVTKNEAAIKDNKEAVAKNEAAIKANTAGIAQLKSAQQNVTALKTKVDQNSARIDQLDNRVSDLDKEVKNGLASQAALSGLFQPYNVGKVNMSAAVGGYKSKTALAVGTGYRFNENVAAKAGVAFSANGGGATYNAGVNFEW
ncbi:YadA C-terminal domain-containing protein [Aggregatibacter aphrophilus]|uniref:YadA C-terminal domain-containing protein n=1 Tax=Aggregatibacter aphrophilus TaxID=732 RepID=UPI000AA8116D|nr:YadA C-terminal domain-containing protein [Aggregatibacter aphrophilus]